MKFHDFTRETDGWQQIATDTLYENDYLQVRADHVRTPTRPGGAHWTVVHRKGAVVIAPMTPAGQFVLIRQERIPIRATIWEFPAGQIDSAAEHDEAGIRATALRELREETGYELEPGGELVPLGPFVSSPGFTDEHSHLFLARPVVPSAAGSQPDEREAIVETRAFTSGELRALIASGEIRDANTLATYARLVALELI